MGQEELIERYTFMHNGDTENEKEKKIQRYTFISYFFEYASDCAWEYIYPYLG